MAAFIRNMRKLAGDLRARGLTVAAAESCTGGAFISALIQIPGASEITQGGIVAYSEAVKIKQLSVKTETIERYGVVSEQVAAEMASGVRAKFGADIGVGVTGFAGPAGECVGKVCFGIDFRGRVKTSCEKFSRGRSAIIRASAAGIINKLEEALKNEKI